MKVSREVDLTRHFDFQKEEPKVRSTSIKQDGVEDYRRYNEYKDDTPYGFPNSTTSTVSSTFVNDPSWGLTNSETQFFSSNFLSSVTPLLPRTKKVEERVCWRKLFRDPDVYVIGYTPEEAVERMKQMNFALGSKQDRLNVEYERYKNKLQHSECECCGRPIRYGSNCLRGFPDLCSKCAESFYKPHIQKVCWR